jgi:molybdate transport repressor ModE-like protein
MSKSFDRLTLLNTFVRIAESGSISAAARDLNMSQPSASRHLVELETQLQTQLMRRNTHSLALTDTGYDLLRDARALLADWDAIEDKHINAKREVKGTLKVVAPVALGQSHLARIATQFQLKHPRINLSWQLEDAQIRFTELGCDCWIKVGTIDDDTLVVKQIARVRRVLVGSRSLFTGDLTPKIDNIQSFPIVSLSPFEAETVPLSNGDVTRDLKFTSSMQTNNIFAVKEACMMGLGLAVMPVWFIKPELNSELLINPLPKWTAPELPINVAYLPNKHHPIRLKLFLEHITNKLCSVDGIDI